VRAAALSPDLAQGKHCAGARSAGAAPALPREERLDRGVPGELVDVLVLGADLARRRS
jgi:hypothetical protein